jgi:rare lipoprotein A
MKFFFSLILLGAISWSLQGQSAAQNVGYAVYYADYLDGETTAMGEIYRKDAFTCAHKYHPKGTLLKVTRLDNNTSVIVRVNDRGPYGEGLIVDLSKVAAKKLDLIKAGKAWVRVEAVGKSNVNPGDDLAGQVPGLASEAPMPVRPDETGGSILDYEAQPNYKVKTYESYSETGEYYGKVKRQEEEADPASRFGVKGVDVRRPPLPASSDIAIKGAPAPLIRQLPAGQKGYVIQLAAYANYDNAQQQYEDFLGKGMKNLFMLQSPDEAGAPVHRILIAAFSTSEKAERYLKSVKAIHGAEGVVFRLQ